MDKVINKQGSIKMSGKKSKMVRRPSRQTVTINFNLPVTSRTLRPIDIKRALKCAIAKGTLVTKGTVGKISVTDPIDYRDR